MPFQLENMDLNIDKKQLKEEVKRKVGFVLRKLPRVLKEIGEKPDSTIRDTLWELRAELELSCVIMKYLLKKDYMKEPWQEEFLKKIKETGKKEKAVKQISEARITDKKFLNLFEKDTEMAYQEIWKLKEALSAGLKAFRTETYRIINGKIEKETEEIFEI